MTVKPSSAFGGPLKAYDGLIATILDQDTGELDVIVIRGHTENWKSIQHGLLDCVRDLANECDRRPGNWKVSAISTPTSILRDIQNTGQHVPEPQGNKGYSSIGFKSYEEYLLAKVGRLDLAIVPEWKHRRAS